MPLSRHRSRSEGLGQGREEKGADRIQMQKEVTREDVRRKREAAQRWANHCSADPSVGVSWRW